MRYEGYQISEIVRILARSKHSVSRAVYPDYREQYIFKSRAYYRAIIKKDLIFLEGIRVRAQNADQMRLKARRYAREIWRQQGSPPSLLEKLNRKYECL